MRLWRRQSFVRKSGVRWFAKAEGAGLSESVFGGAHMFKVKDADGKMWEHWNPGCASGGVGGFGLLGKWRQGILCWLTLPTKNPGLEVWKF